MILFYIFILIPIIASLRNAVPSYRSSVMEGDKPILRMPKELSGYQSDDEDREPEVIHVEDHGEMVRDLSLLIKWLVENFGYDLVPQGRRNKGQLEPETEAAEPTEEPDEADEVADDAPVTTTEETTEETGENVPIGAEHKRPQKSVAEAAWQAADEAIEEAAEGLLEDQPEDPPIVELRQVKSKPPKATSKKIARMLPTEKDEKHAKSKSKLREKKKSGHDDARRWVAYWDRKHHTKPVKSQTPRKGVDPNWMTDLKEFMKDLITRFGQKDLDKYTKPVITSLEKKHNVLITDIDVDQYGEILVSYIDRGGKKKPAATPKALRYNPKTEDW